MNGGTHTDRRRQCLLPNVRAVLDYAVSEIPRKKYLWAYPIMAMIGRYRLKRQ